MGRRERFGLRGLRGGEGTPIERGLAAAWRAPRYLEHGRLRELVEEPAGGRAGGARGAMTARAPRRALWAARLATRALGRIPGAGRRDTCLYRAIAECAVLRSYGVPATLRLSIGAPGGAPEAARARGARARASARGHAWVEAAGHAALERAGRRGAEMKVAQPARAAPAGQRTPRAVDPSFECRGEHDRL